jgi:hypothetical protein
MHGNELVYESARAMTPLSRTCREVAALLVAREDRALGMSDRAALRIHLAICNTCPVFEKQILALRSGMRMWRNYAISDDSETDVAKKL